MRLTFDPLKSERNLLERGLPFSKAEDFDWSTALIAEDLRKRYDERRFQALGMLDGHLHMLVLTPRNDDLHVISLRRANLRERKRHGHSQTRS